MSNEHVLDDFIQFHQLTRKTGISVVTFQSLQKLTSAGFSVEDLLNRLSTYYHALLHGSRTDIVDSNLKSKNRIYGSDLASIAIMRAILSNVGLQPPGLSYPYIIDEHHPLEVRIHGITNSTIGNNGFIYILNDRTGFENKPEGSWQYVTKRNSVPISAKIPINKSDFKYPIFDVTNNRQIQ